MPSSDAVPAIAVDDLSVAYREAPALWDVDLRVPTGAVMAIVGPNGAGKSTLLKAILGLVPVAAGAVRVFGEPYDRVRRRVAYVPQRTSVDWGFPATVRDVVTMGTHGRLGWLRRPGVAERIAVDAALDALGLADLAPRQIGQLSGGQQQRTFLARALVQNADLVMMDEPFQGVDAVTERAIVDVLQRLAAEGRTVVAVHHDLDTVLAYFTHVLLLNVRAVAAGPVASTFTDAHLRQTFGALVRRQAAVDVPALPALPGALPQAAPVVGAPIEAAP